MRMNSKRPIEFTIEVKVKTGMGCFTSPALLDSGTQDCFIDEEFTRLKGLKFVELPGYLQQCTQNANNTLSMQRLKYEVHCMVEFQGHYKWISLVVMTS